MDKIIEIRMKRSVLFLSIILLFVVFVIPYFYSFYFSEKLSLLLHLSIIFIIIFLIVSFIDGFFVKVTLLENVIIKKSLLINKVIEIKQIREAKVLKYQNSIIIKTENKRLGIGWDYERHQEFKELLIKELEKNKIPIIYKNKWWK